MPEHASPSSSFDRQHTIAEPSSEISQAVKHFVQIEVENQLAKEQKLLKESAGIAVKIIGAAAALFLAIFTVFGLTTWREIKQEAVLVVKQQAQELIQRADSDTNVKDTLNDLLNRTVVSAYLTTQRRGPAQRMTLSSNDWDRLRDWIKNEDLPLQDFSDTLAILNLQSDERKKTDANRLLAELLNPPKGSPYRWIVKQPEKTEAILANFKHKDLGLSAVELVVSNEINDLIRGQAADYVREVQFVSGVGKLFATYKTLPWGHVKRHTLVASVAMRPDRREVIAEMKRLLFGDPISEKIDAIADIIVLKSQSQSLVNFIVNKNEFRAVLKDLLFYAAKNGLYFQFSYSNMFKRGRGSDRDEAPKGTTSSPLQIILGVSSGNSTSSSEYLTVDEFRGLNEYWELISELANAGDIDHLRLLLPIEDSVGSFLLQEQSLVRLTVSADAGAKVIVVGEDNVPKDHDLSSLKNASVDAFGRFLGREALLHWEDEAGQILAAKLVGLSGANYQFSISDFDNEKLNNSFRSKNVPQRSRGSIP